MCIDMCVCVYIIDLHIHTHKISLLCSHSHIWNPLMLFAVFHVSAQTKVISGLWKWQRVNN